MECVRVTFLYNTFLCACAIGHTNGDNDGIYTSVIYTRETTSKPDTDIAPLSIFSFTNHGIAPHSIAEDNTPVCGWSNSEANTSELQENIEEGWTFITENFII